jgi:predicted secreted Zn-dependent protease
MTIKRRVSVAQRVQELEAHILNLGSKIGRIPPSIHALLDRQAADIKQHFDHAVSAIHSQQRAMERRVRAMEERESVRDGLTLAVEAGNGGGR